VIGQRSVTTSSDKLDVTGTHLLFAYGTLRRGFERHGVLQRLVARYIGEGVIEGELFDLGEFPGARKSVSGASRVRGEVYRLPGTSQAFSVLDSIEGYQTNAADSSLFVREITDVTLPNGKQVQAWVYWLNRWHGPMRRVTSGDYRRG